MAFLLHLCVPVMLSTLPIWGKEAEKKMISHRSERPLATSNVSKGLLGVTPFSENTL